MRICVKPATSQRHLETQDLYRLRAARPELALLSISQCSLPVSANVEACGLCQSPLAFVKSPKSLCLEFDSAGDVQAVKRADAEFGSIPPAKIGTYFQGSFRHRERLPDSCSAVIIEVAMQLACFDSGHLSAKHLLCNRMRPFGNVKRRNRRAFAAAQHLVGCDRVSVLHIKGDEKAGVGINRQ